VPQDPPFLSVSPSSVYSEDMAETAVIMQALKIALRARGITYADVAERLDLSESSVKRLFSGNDLSLKRLDEICALAELEISDLVHAVDEQRPRLDTLPLDIEQTLVDDPHLMLVAWCAVNYWTFDEILAWYRFDTPELIKLFTTLDRLKVLELLPGNRVRLLVSANFRWRPGGPIERFFQREVQHRFLDSHFKRENELRLVLTSMLSTVSSAELIDRLRRLSESFERCAIRDRNVPLDQRHGTTLLVAIRPWLFDAFTQFERVSASPSARPPLGGRPHPGLGLNPITSRTDPATRKPRKG